MHVNHFTSPCVWDGARVRTCACVCAYMCRYVHVCVQLEKVKTSVCGDGRKAE